MREERKREALERSRLRQADPNYFASRLVRPEPSPLPEVQAEAAETKEEGEKEEEVEEEVEAGGEDESLSVNKAEVNDDPFRTTSGRFKVFVR